MFPFFSFPTSFLKSKYVQSSQHNTKKNGALKDKLELDLLLLFENININIDTNVKI